MYDKTNMQDSRTYKALFLLNLLSHKAYNKTEIIKEFEKNNVKISKSSIVNYIEKLKAFNIPIKTNRIDGVDTYSLNKQDITIDINEREALIAQDVKKLLMVEKDYENIRRAIVLFYKFSLLTPNIETRLQLADFGYYSTINWELVKELKHHCEQKNIIELDYLLPQGGNRIITMHADEVYMGNWSERLYLRGTFVFANQFSQLPIDRIFMVRRIVDKRIRFDLETEVLTYKIDKNIVNTLELEEQEVLSGIEGDLAVIKRPIDDNFALIQRLLYFCPDLYYVSNDLIRSRVQEKLLILKDLYDDRPE